MDRDKNLKQWALNHGWVRTPGKGPGGFSEWSHPGIGEGYVPLLGEEIDAEGTLSDATREKMLVHQARVHEAQQIADRENVRQRELKN
ncbi:MAG: hypothetical protein QM723_34295 [Myxococcaceae bacterium]